MNPMTESLARLLGEVETGWDLATELRQRRAELLERLGGLVCPEEVAGEAEALWRDLNAVDLCLRRLPQVEAHAAWAAAVARAMGLQMLAEVMDAEFPGNDVSRWVRDEAAGL